MMKYFPLMASISPANTQSDKRYLSQRSGALRSVTSLKKAIARALALVLLFTTQLACTATTLPPYEAAYTTKLRGIKITGTRKFENTGENRYKVSWKAKALWMRLNEWSEFELVNGEVRPLSYHYTRQGLGSDRPIHIYFDYDNNQINASKGKDKYQFALQPGTLDKLSYQVQMQIDLLERPQAKNLAYTVANHDRLKKYAFTYQQTDIIDTQLGEVEALLFKRRKNEKKSTEIWLSPLQYYLPVKIQQTEGKDKSVASIKYWKSDAGTNTGNNVSLSSLGRNMNNLQPTAIGNNAVAGDSEADDDFADDFSGEPSPSAEDIEFGGGF